MSERKVGQRCVAVMCNGRMSTTAGSLRSGLAATNPIVLSCLSVGCRCCVLDKGVDTERHSRWASDAARGVRLGALGLLGSHGSLVRAKQEPYSNPDYLD